MKKIIVMFFVFSIFVFVSDVRAQDFLALQEQIDSLKEEVLILNRKVYRDKTDANVSLAASGNSSFGEYDEIIRNLNGKIEELEYKLKQTDERLSALNKDMETRFNILEGKPISAGTSSLSEQKKYAPVVAKGAPKSIVGDNVRTEKLKEISYENESVDTLYKKGLEFLKNNDTASAEQNFLLILENYPSDKLAGNAQYWLGEVYYKDQNYSAAAVAFAKGYEKYKNGNKGADSLYKLGLSMSRLDKKNEACAAFGALPSEFPKAEADLLSRAKTQFSKLGCK